MTRHVIFNADDFGASTGINRGIIDAHTRGVVTSTSLMVEGKASEQAIRLSRENPNLGIGLHWDVLGEDERTFDFDNQQGVRDEFKRQLDLFHKLMRRMPTHIDSHKHTHTQPNVMPIFQELAADLKLPLRRDGRIHYIGGFYAQWEWLVTDLKYVSVEFLQQLLREETKHEWNEFCCHPGYASPDFQSVYLTEREVETRTLTDRRIRQTIEQLDLRLANFSDYTKAQA
jgi:chitin disaccharide deacetylase